MSGTKYLIFSSFAIVCVFAQYDYPYYGSRTYPNQGFSVYRPPGQSPCGKVRPTSYCQHLPCYSYPSYRPYYYNNRQYPNRYENVFPGSRVASTSTGQYGKGFVYPSFRSTSSDPYANVPVDIIDDDGTSRPKLKLQGTVSKQDEYANVPVEIIDADDYVSFWRNIPKLPPKVTQNTQTLAGASVGTLSSDSVTQIKPVRATITRTIQPLRKNPIINLDFVNGEQLSEKTGKEEENDKTTQIPVTTAPSVTTEESEEVSEVKSWF